MRDPRRNPVPAKYRYPRKPEQAAGRRRRLLVIVAAAVLILIIAGSGVGFFFLSSSTPVDATQRAAVESFTIAILNVEGGRESVAVEFQRVGTEINTTEFAEVFKTLDSVIRQQEELAQEMQSLDSSSNVTALAHTLLADAYEGELEGYRMLLSVAQQAQSQFPTGTARRTRRTDGYDAAVSRLSSAERSRVRAFEELEDLLKRVELTLEEVSSTK